MENKRGFTIIELIVVIAIIAVLAVIVSTSVNFYVVKSRDARRKADIEPIQKALEMYYAEYSHYPISLNDTNDCPSQAWSNSNDESWANLQTALAPYLSKLPEDPKQTTSGCPSRSTGYSYTYYRYYSSTCELYVLVYRLEIAEGPDTGAYISCTGSLQRYGGTGENTYVKTVGVRRP